MSCRGHLKRTHPEKHSITIEQFLVMPRFEQRDKLAELSVDHLESGQDDFV